MRTNQWINIGAVDYDRHTARGTISLPAPMMNNFRNGDKVKLRCRSQKADLILRVSPSMMRFPLLNPADHISLLQQVKTDDHLEIKKVSWFKSVFNKYRYRLIAERCK